MALKKINENPKISDTILLEIATPNAAGCFDENPYKVDSVIIYHVERDFLGINYGEYVKSVSPDSLQNELDKLKKEICESPSLELAQKIVALETEIDSASQKSTIYYKEKRPVHVVGNESFPAWLSSDIDNAFLKLQETDIDGNTQYGRFTYEWNPAGSAREGDYFVCWTWTPLPAGEKLSAHLHFSIEGDGLAVSTVPSHSTPEGKYETLLERYLPEMYKYTLGEKDITPRTTELFNLAVAKGFTFIEDMANQIIDLFDANALHESLLKYLANTFAVKLRSSDPTLWRRQIKEAIPLFKMKGTLEGLKKAFAQAGMVFNSYTQYWQIVSPYTWVQVFTVEDRIIFDLEKDNIVLPLDLENFSLQLKRANNTTYENISSDNVAFETGDDGIVRMTWVSEQLSSGSIDLFQGDKIKIMYQYKEIASEPQQTLENYIRSLPLMDQRDENDQEYPPKNWNVRLIAEDDPLFPVLIPVKHPFADPLQFGWVRTEFAYSENIYNAEEYNGSTRPSFDPCKIDKNFIDPCGSCLSSSYSVDIGVEELSNDRMLEAQDILREFMPFHSQILSLNFTGEVNEFVQSPVEQIESLITIDYSQYILSGNSNPFFYRNMEGGLSNWTVTRDDLTNQATVSSGHIGVAYNEQIAFLAPDYNLKSLGVNVENHILEILAPSVNTGTYTIDQIQGSMARVSSNVIEPLDKSAFTFRLSNIQYGNSYTSITQDNLILVSDAAVDFATLGVKTLWDTTYTPDYGGGAWKLLIPAYSSEPYIIKNIVDGSLILQGDSNLPTSNIGNVSYSLLNDLDETVQTSTTGYLNITLRGYVNLNDTAILNLEDFIKTGDYLIYDGQEYLISESEGLNFWIDEYQEGDAVGVNAQIRRRLVENGTGYFGYKGLRLTTTADHEAEFEIVNGKNKPSSEDDVIDDNKFFQNFMFQIGDEYYKIASIDGSEVILNGREQDWTTLTAGGSAVEYSIVQFEKKQVNVGFIVFDHLDRSGYDPVVREIYSNIDNNTAIVALSKPKSSGVQENVSQEEGVSIKIEMKSGETLEGDL